MTATRSAGRRTRVGAAALVVLAAVATGGSMALTGCSSSAGSTAGSKAASSGASGADGANAKAGSPAALAVSGGYIPQPLLTDMAAAYFTVTNTGGTAAQLTSVTSGLAAHATLHTTSNDTMQQVMSLTVPAGGKLTLSTGGDHVMLEDLTHKPAVGDKVTLTLHFAHATPAAVTVTVPVRPTTYQPEG
ncbi:copper chaperone PCu(A)C [Actinacidiphila sp. bgisy145]|uniref:copper chaperone PCu(A)C n=1 Tax=Actinacidiphila sp. bgisy145 TaxID=3413792 RepID=UPI003EC10979